MECEATYEGLSGIDQIGVMPFISATKPKYTGRIASVICLL